MGRNRFVGPEVTRIALSDGDWIEVKTLITNGDQKAIDSAGAMSPTLDPASGRVFTPIDWQRCEIERAMVMVMDWSLHNAEDKPVKLSKDAMRSIDPESFEEIILAVNKHIVGIAIAKKEKREAKAAEEKPTPPSTATELASELPSS